MVRKLIGYFKLNHRVKRLESLKTKIHVYLPLEVHYLQRPLSTTSAEELSR